MNRRRRILALLFAAIAILILAGGSVVEGAALLGIGVPESYPGARFDVAAYSLIFLWLPTLLMVALCGSMALLLARQRQALPSFLAASLWVAMFSTFFALAPGALLPVHG